MKYMGMPMGMWALFRKSFQTHLTSEFGLTPETAKTVTAQAKGKYQEILADLPEFESGDCFKLNLVGCAMLAAFILSMPERPDVQTLTDYYAKAMMTPTMK